MDCIRKTEHPLSRSSTSLFSQDIVDLLDALDEYRQARADRIQAGRDPGLLRRGGR